MEQQQHTDEPRRIPLPPASARRLHGLWAAAIGAQQAAQAASALAQQYAQRYGDALQAAAEGMGADAPLEALSADFDAGELVVQPPATPFANGVAGVSG